MILDTIACFDLTLYISSYIESEVFRVVIANAHEKGEPAPINNSDAAGIGKSTLGTLLAAHPRIAKKYSVFWVKLPSTATAIERDVITYEQYMRCLNSLCHALSLSPNWLEPVLRLENTSIRIRREKEFMTRAKHAMARLLQSMAKPLLLILDDVRDEVEMELFQFFENQSSIVISQCKCIRATCTLPLEPLSEDEALQIICLRVKHSKCTRYV